MYMNTGYLNHSHMDFKDKMQLHLLFIWYFKESSFHSKGANLNVE